MDAARDISGSIVLTTMIGKEIGSFLMIVSISWMGLLTYFCAFFAKWFIRSYGPTETKWSGSFRISTTRCVRSAGNFTRRSALLDVLVILIVNIFRPDRAQYYAPRLLQTLWMLVGWLRRSSALKTRLTRTLH